MGDVDRNADAFPTVTPSIPTVPIPTLTNTGSVFFSRPSVWLAGGTMALLILEALLLALHQIPTAQLDTFKTLEGGTMLLFGIMVRDVFHGDNK